ARIFLVVLAGSVFLALANIFTNLFYFKISLIPVSVIIIDALVTMAVMISSRLAIKAFYFENKNPEKQKTNVIIYGAGESGIITKRTLDRDAAVRYKVVGFIDDDPKKSGRSLEGAFIYGPDKMEKLISENEVETVIISILNLTAEK